MTSLIIRLLPMLALLAAVTGCSVSPYQPSQPPVDDRSSRAEPASPSSDPETETAPPYDPAIASPLPDTTPAPESDQTPAPALQVRQNTAVIALLNDAEQSRTQGDYQAAQGSLQRAQRIAPRDPEVYYSLALTHLELEDYDLAEQVALKGVSVAQGNRYQSQRLWKLIARIRLRAGDPEGARQAEQKAGQYS